MESKGRNPRHAKILELGIVVLELERETNKICKIVSQDQWFQDPGEETTLTEAFIEKTGITEEMLRDQSIDHEKVESIFSDSEVIIAFNAGFIRPILENQYPDLEDAVFACARNQIEWTAKGHESRSLFHLTRDHYWYSDAQRTLGQCAMLVKLLSEDTGFDGEPVNYLNELINRAQEPLITVEARVEFHQKHLMKKERFHWDNREKTFMRSMGTSTLDRVKKSLDAKGFTGELIERDRLAASERFK
jgi:DNA polymerase III epsilon subunit-like protein